MPQARGGRPRDAQLHDEILVATFTLLVARGYAEVSMDSVAALAGVSKKTLYRRWPSKAPMVAEAVLSAYGRRSTFEVPETGDLRADLRSWLVEHAEFLGEATNAALIRSLIAGAAASPMDNEALYRQLSVPQHDGLVTRLGRAAADGEIRRGLDHERIADALIGTLLLRVLVAAPQNSAPATEFDGLLDALLHGIGPAE
jgi:AcrR family transcriptional regulator